jgi:hypothetical protein
MASVAFADLLADFGEAAEPEPSPYRWHCTRCGRFVRSATVRKLDPWPGETDEHEYRGTCRAHGENVDVVWGQP